jgi:hypothetical protein
MVPIVSSFLLLRRLSRPDGDRHLFPEDIFSRVPAVFIIALGNYVVPCAHRYSLSGRVTDTSPYQGYN